MEYFIRKHEKKKESVFVLSCEIFHASQGKEGEEEEQEEEEEEEEMVRQE